MIKEQRLFYWLLRAYFAHNKAEWEEGPTINETMDNIFDVLCNNGLDPNISKDILVKIAKDDSRKNKE